MDHSRAGLGVISGSADNLAEFFLFRALIERICGQDRHIAYCRIMIVVLLSVNGNEMWMRHFQLFRFFVHQIGIRFRTAGDMFGNRDRRVVAGGQHHAVQKILERILISFLDAHQWIAASEIDRVVRDGDHIVKIAVFECNDAGQDLRRPGGKHLLVRIALQSAIGGRGVCCIDQNKIRLINGIDIESVRLRFKNRGEEQSARGKKRSKNKGKNSLHNLYKPFGNNRITLQFNDIACACQCIKLLKNCE